MGTGPLVVIVGPTASGKTALAIKLAEKFNGEILCADSRTVYKGMDIGTAKPSIEEQKHIPHHLLDVAEPNQAFTVADFKRLALTSIEDIHDRGKLPIMVGGSGLYIDAVLFDYKFAPRKAPRDPHNPRHLDKEVSQHKSTLRPKTIIVGLDINREKLKKRIEERVDSMLQAGLEAEARALGSKYGWGVEPMRAPAYAATRGYVFGEYDLETARLLFARADLKLAKKQRTWFKRNKSIHWVNDPKESVDIVTTFLNNL